MAQITTIDFQEMVSHWLATPPNGYLGSGYGSPLKDMLQTPMRSGLADSFLTKLRVDVPLAGALPPSALNVYVQDEAPDKRRIFIEASGQIIDIPG
jgi:hypothetical protein